MSVRTALPKDLHSECQCGEECLADLFRFRFHSLSLSLSLIVTAVSVAAAAATTAVASAVDIAVNFDSAPELSPYSTVETSPSSTAVAVAAAAAAVTVAHCSLITAHTLTLLHLSPILISSSLCLFVFLQSIHFFHVSSLHFSHSNTPSTVGVFSLAVTHFSCKELLLLLLLLLLYAGESQSIFPDLYTLTTVALYRTLLYLPVWYQLNQLNQLIIN